MSLLRPLAALAVGTPSEEVSPCAIAAAEKMILDTIAVSIAGASAPGVKECLAQMDEWGGREECSVLFPGNRLPPSTAAFANSLLAHALDFDDVHVPTSLHLMCLVWPAALAAAEAAGGRTQPNGRDLLEAVVMGVEVAARCGLAYNRRRRGPRGSGFLPTSVVGGFGAVAAMARLWKLSEEQTMHAFALNYAQASGNRQALFDGSLAKRIQPAFATRSAVWAVALAARGVTGPLRALDGKAGLFALYLGAEPPEEGELMAVRPFFEIERETVKRYPVCGAAHPLIDAAIELATETDLHPGGINRAELYFGPNGNNLVGKAFSLEGNPQVNAQFSAPYAVALALTRREAGFRRFREETIRGDREVLDLAARVCIVRDVETPPAPRPVPEDYPSHTGKPHVLVVRMNDGTALRRERTPAETLDPAAVSFEDVSAKLRDCVGDARATAAIQAAVLELRDAPGPGELMEACCGLEPADSRHPEIQDCTA